METKQFVKDLLALREQLADEIVVLRNLIASYGASVNVLDKAQENLSTVESIDRVLTRYGVELVSLPTIERRPGAAGKSKRKGRLSKQASKQASKPSSSGRITTEEKENIIGLFKEGKTIDQIAEAYKGRFTRQTIWYHLNKLGKIKGK